MKDKTKIIIGVLILASILMFSILKDVREEPKIIKLADVEIPADTLTELTKPLGEGEFILCNMNTDKCVLSQKVNLNANSQK